MHPVVCISCYFSMCWAVCMVFICWHFHTILHIIKSDTVWWGDVYWPLYDCYKTKENKHAIFHELWVLQRSKIAEGHWQLCHSIGHRWFPIGLIILHHFQDINDYLPKFKQVMWPWPRPLKRLFLVWRLILYMANQCAKFEVYSLSHSRDILGGLKI